MKLSIIVPVYKVRRHLQRCIESILQQTYTDYELILVDDCSSWQNVVPVLKKYGLITARTTENGPWNLKKQDLMRVPCTPLQKDNKLAFYQAVSSGEKGEVPVILFHGVPDIVHDWVNTSPECFAAFMKYLFDNDYRVISMKQYLQENGLC